MNDSINQYMTVVKQLQESINSIEGTLFLDNHKKNLFFSLIEFMAKATYGDKYRKNRPRFVNFIMDFANWEFGNRVSLQQLVLVLQQVEDV